MVGDAGLYRTALLRGRAVTPLLPGSAPEPPAPGDDLWASSEAPKQAGQERAAPQPVHPQGSSVFQEKQDS